MRGPTAALTLLLAIAGCGGSARATTTASQTTSGDETTAPTQAPEDLVRLGVSLTQSHRCADAIRVGYEPAIAVYQRQFAPGVRVMASRAGGGAALLSLITAADAGQSAVVIDSGWSDTLYLEAFCQVELGHPELARQLLRRALEMIPGDVAYSCELGNLMQEAHDWRGALEIYRGALENAAMLERTGAFTPSQQAPEGPLVLGQSLAGWTRRAMRGVGFSLIELGDLDGAEHMFQQVLALDPNDERAMNELRYIAELRAGS